MNAHSADVHPRQRAKRPARTEPDLLVVGAGLFGLTVAVHAARDGAKVLVLERRSYIGGNASDYLEESTGVRVHRHGAHLLHSPHEEVWNYLGRFTEFAPYEHRVFGTPALGRSGCRARSRDRAGDAEPSGGEPSRAEPERGWARAECRACPRS
ncbi:FAD-dependent oxidoreductase [Frigoribacterium sp. CFBP 8766]|uniref:FAD-dependent oxidoreductase n=1 Tax=Frigoribacterium sp. CFBP 8766 TaxID=2775273 RepID=UPI00177C87CF|nr:FAD-dependent oxidoreductase [Frigoribacterium sp. CFBP 8766]MBD8583783.1 FAD-dependent oxidoreductase [Frigoribacterium sp. CFBP 8766]